MSNNTPNNDKIYDEDLDEVIGDNYQSFDVAKPANTIDSASIHTQNAIDADIRDITSELLDRDVDVDSTPHNPNTPDNQGTPPIQGTPVSNFTPITEILAPPKRVWERLPEESHEAFSAWEIYIQVKDEDAGGLNEVARRCGKSESQMQKWSSRFNWKDRYVAYETFNLQMMESERRKALRKEADKWAKRRSEIRDLGYELGLMLAERAKRLLALPLARQTITKTVKTASGEVVPQEIHLEFQSHPKDARLFLETGLKQMRLSADMSTENIGYMPENVDLENMSTDELEAYAERLLALRKDDSAAS